MFRFLAAVTSLALLGGGPLLAQSTNTASDNPLAGLKLDDSDGSTSAASTPFLAKFDDHLVVLNGDHTKPADPATLKGVQFVAFYYSASWCPPCRAFTPKLVEFYNAFKSSHPNFELIFVDDDSDADAMLGYMVMDKMPWPAVRFDDISSSRVQAKKYMGPGIPDLVLVDANGKVLADSWVGGNYAGPDSVIDAIKQQVPQPQATTTAGP